MISTRRVGLLLGRWPAADWETWAQEETLDRSPVQRLLHSEARLNVARASPSPHFSPDETPTRMVNRNLIRELETGAELDKELELALAGAESEEYSVSSATLAVNSVLVGRVLRVDDEFVLVDVGYKSEGQIPRSEWEDGRSRSRRLATPRRCSSRNSRTAASRSSAA